MFFLIVGIILMALKFFELTAVAHWSWFTILIPFGLAALWWTFADSAGFTSRKAVKKEELRRKERQERNRVHAPGRKRSNK